jgi:hypothetical protein
MITDRIATLSDFRAYGAGFGIECAIAVERKKAEGLSEQAIRDHVAAMERVKRAQLASIGSVSDIEMDNFFRTAGACYAALSGDDLILNRRQRRAFRRRT